MKKLLSFALAAAFAMCLCVSVYAASFGDVLPTDYYAAAAERMAERGILSGYGDGKYHGGEPITRAQTAALVCKLLGKADEAAALEGETVFSDVNATAWYTGYINYAVANKIIVGDGNGRFRPDDYVKYEEIIKVVVCVLGLDSEVEIQPGDWSREYIEAADKARLLGGLVGKKGTPMLRSDIAVLCDAAVTLLDEAAKGDSTSTNKSVSGVASGKGEEATSPEETYTTRENELPSVPIN